MIEVLAQEVFTPQFGFPGAPAGQTADLSLLANLYKFLFGLGIVAAIISIIVAGAMYIFSGFGGAQPTAVKKAQRRLVMTLVGLVILLSIDFIINQIDPGIKTPKLVLKKISKLTTSYVIPYDAGIPSLEGNLVGFIFLASETTTNWRAKIDTTFIPITSLKDEQAAKLAVTGYIASRFYNMSSSDLYFILKDRYDVYCMDPTKVSERIRRLHSVLDYLNQPILQQQKEEFNNTLNRLIKNKGEDLLKDLEFAFTYDATNFKNFNDFMNDLKNKGNIDEFFIKFNINFNPSSASMTYVKDLINMINNNAFSAVKFKKKNFLRYLGKYNPTTIDTISYCSGGPLRLFTGEDDNPEAVLIDLSLAQSIKEAVKWTDYLANSCNVKLTITEAWPPSAKHIDHKHYNGKAIDISYKDAVDNDDCEIQSLAKFVQGLSAQNNIDVIAFEFNKANPNDPLGKCLTLLGWQAFEIDRPLDGEYLFQRHNPHYPSQRPNIDINEFENGCEEPFKSLIKFIASSSMGWGISGSDRGKIKFAGYEHVVGHPLHIEVK